jgi:uncharacterized membrane protein (DUF2068 family)
MPEGRSSLLPWIVAFKAVKAVALTALGLTLLFGVHRDPVEVVMRIAQAVHLPVTSRLFDLLVTFAINATRRKELTLAITALGYAVVIAVEGVGLHLRRAWARWFTIGVTGSLIPLEVYEILQRQEPMRVAILVLNVAVVAYLWRRKEAFE